MITLKELLNSAQKDKESGLVNIDDWRWTDIDHLVTMGFEFGDDYHLHTNKDPKMTIYRKKDSDEMGNIKSFFFIEEPNRQTKRFREFDDVVDYFDHYPQEEIDQYK